jgi:phenylacetate-CoA ligase
MSDFVRKSVLRLHQVVTGRHILDQLIDLQRTQWLGRDELEDLQDRKLIQLVEYAYQNVPYYHSLFDQVGFHPSDMKKDKTTFQRIPVLTKEIVRSNQDTLQTIEAARQKRMIKVTTSGSTGHPLSFYEDSDFRDRFTAAVQLHLGWAGAELWHRHAYIWGACFEVKAQQALRTRLIDWEWNRFITNAFLLSDQSLEVFARRVCRERPDVLMGFASSVHNYAHFVRQRPEFDISFKGIITSAEVLLPEVRNYIEETFHCKIFNRYSTRELDGIACECEAHDGLHASLECNYIEIIKDGRPAEPGEVGQIIVTNLDNRGMPFIRYQINDEGSWSKSGPCPCGRSSPKIGSVEGRIVDTFVAADGRKVWAGFAGAAYKCLVHPSIRQFQVVQESLDYLTIRIVRDGPVPQENMEQFAYVIRRTFGDHVQVCWEFPDEIPVLPSGKHQYAVSKLNSI